MRTIALADHQAGEYLRADEIARRFDVSIDDVLAACTVLGFDAHDASSLIEIELFFDAVMHVPVHPRETDSRTSLLLRIRIGGAATVAVVLAALGVSLAVHDHTASLDRARRAAAYRAELESTYDATVGAQPTPNAYTALAQQLTKITPPTALRAAHAHLVAEADRVAALSAAAPDCAALGRANDPTCMTAAVAAVDDPATAANTLKTDIGRLAGTPAP